MNYLRARYYDPSTGQFMSPDPLTVTTRQPYSYVLDSPLNLTDPNGLWTFGICLGGSAGWGPGGFIQGCIVTANFQQWGVTGTLGGGGQSPAAGGQLQLQSSNGNNISDLGGPFAYGGGSVVVGPDIGLTVGGDGFVGTNSCNQTIAGGDIGVGLGARLPLPFEFHGGASFTGYHRFI